MQRTSAPEQISPQRILLSETATERLSTFAWLPPAARRDLSIEAAAAAGGGGFCGDGSASSDGQPAGGGLTAEPERTRGIPGGLISGQPLGGGIDQAGFPVPRGRRNCD